MHICSPKFKEFFRKVFLLESNTIADNLEMKETDYPMSNQKNVALLFTNKYLYPLTMDLPDLPPKEGRFSIARAQTLLKLFYLSIVDTKDNLKFQ